MARVGGSGLISRGCALCTLACLLISPALGDQTRRVAIQGQAAPGASVEAIFSRFDTPTLNNSGLVAFRAHMALGLGSVDSYTDSGVWSEGDGSLALVARESDQAPGTPFGALFNTPEETVFLSDTGQVAFTGTLRQAGGGVNSLNNYGIWAGADGTLSLVARARDQAPDVPLGARFSRVGTQVQSSDPHLFSVSNSGLISFDGRLEDTNDEAGVTNLNADGIWLYESTIGQLRVRASDQAPGTPTGAKFFDLQLPSLNNVGRVSFIASLASGGGGVNNNNFTGIWSSGRGSLELIARQGDQAPGIDPADTFHQFLWQPAINDSGDVAFLSTLTTGANSPFIQRQGIWSNVSGSLSLVAVDRTAAPGAPTGVNFEYLGSPVINGSGEIAFMSYLTLPSGEVMAPTVADSGIWSNVGGELKLVARRGLQVLVDGVPPEVMQGTQVPGAVEGTEFARFTSVSLNGAGQVAFSALASDQGYGIWAQDRDGVLQLIVREGSQIDVDNGTDVDLRTVESIKFFGGSGNEDGRASGFNDLGQVAFAASFTDNTWGVFVSNLVANIDSLAGDFDGDGDVDGRDFLLWQRDPNVGNLADWQQTYGESAVTPFGTVNIPEPACYVLLSSLCLLLISQQRSI